MTSDTDLKLNNILREFLVEQKDVTEVMLNEGNRVFYKMKGEVMSYQLSWDLTNDDIRTFQHHYIIEKSWGEDMDENGDERNKTLLDLIEKFESDGSLEYSMEIEGKVFRVNWSLWRWKHFMRIRKILSQVPSPKDLWIPEVIRNAVREHKQWGLIIVSSPPWTGKSVTIASVMQELVNEQTLNIITLEDPIEYIYNEKSKSMIQQRERVFDFSTFEKWVEACMRQTPDIVLIQEMTTPKIIQDAMLLASKGVLVITTLHTDDTSSIFESITSAFPFERKKEILWKLATSFRCFISQRLIPKADWSWLIASFEVLVNTSEVRWNIIWDRTQYLAQSMWFEPHILFSKDLYTKINNGDITLDKWLEYCPGSRIWFLKEDIWIE